MTRPRFPLAMTSTLIAVLLAAAGLAVGAEATLEQIGAGNLLPSEPAAVLGPITESGRTGWDCAPERAARAKKIKAAGLPSAQR